MKCPRCGEELRQSKKDPTFGLCDNCKKKFKWVEEVDESYIFEPIKTVKKPKTNSKTKSKKAIYSMPPAAEPKLERPIKKKKSILPKILIIIIIAIIAIVTIGFFFGGDETENPTTDSDQNITSASDYATKDNPANAREKNTVEWYDGTFSFKLDNAYIGEDGNNKLIEMGEDLEGYEVTEGYRTVLLEYTVSADSGFESEPFECSTVLGGNLWSEDDKSTYEYYVLSLYENAGLDYSNLKLKAGEESKMYVYMELPKEVSLYKECITGLDRDYWFIYNLE